jgi:hypothetical protein
MVKSCCFLTLAGITCGLTLAGVQKEFTWQRLRSAVIAATAMQRYIHEFGLCVRWAGLGCCSYRAWLCS